MSYDKFCNWLEQKINNIKKFFSPYENGYVEDKKKRKLMSELAAAQAARELKSFLNNDSFYEKGNEILVSNGWIYNNHEWKHPNYPFTIIKSSKGYNIIHKDAGYKTITIVKNENILKRIKEYNIYLKAKSTKINKNNFLSDFE